ncbi:hypothetical protein FOG50_00383 [Hanseniaspora uvarum]|nr:hypothetical protein FOG50_00383 [Hanseniaspora uvarum]
MDVQTEVGQPVPPNSEYSYSVCLPTWEDVIKYNNKDRELLQKLSSGHPRYVIHKSIQQLCNLVLYKYSKVSTSSNDISENCLPFSSYNVAKRCREYIKVRKHVENSAVNQDYPIRILQLKTGKPLTPEETKYKQQCTIACVFVHVDDYVYLREYWQLTGEGISTRCAEYMLKNIEQLLGTQLSEFKVNQSLLSSGKIDVNYITNFNKSSIDLSTQEQAKYYVKLALAKKNNGYPTNHTLNNTNRVRSPTPEPVTAQNLRTVVSSTSHEAVDFVQHFVEENGSVSATTDMIQEDFGGQSITSGSNSNLRSELASSPLSNLSLSNTQQIFIDPKDDVYLFPTGISAVFTAHRLLLELDSIRVRRTLSNSSGSKMINKMPIGYGYPYMKTVMFGTPCNDTLSILQKFNHCHYIPSMDLRELLRILQSGEQILAVFLEAPTNPTLEMPDLVELHKLSKLFGFYIVVDDSEFTVNSSNILPYCDMLISSLTKIFKNNNNVLAGSLILNRQSKLYNFGLKFFEKSYEYLLWCEDCILLNENSKNYDITIKTINSNTEWLVDNVFKKYKEEGYISSIFYPKLMNKFNFDILTTPSTTGYGEGFNIVFTNEDMAKRFYDNLDLNKTPTVGTSCTVVFPYLMLSSDQSVYSDNRVKPWLLRITIGDEDKLHLKRKFELAFNTIH